MSIQDLEIYGQPYWEYRPRFMWDVGASEQDITNVMEGIGGRGGYGTLSPPAMGLYGSLTEPCGWSVVCGILAGLVLGYIAGHIDTKKEMKEESK